MSRSKSKNQKRASAKKGSVALTTTATTSTTATTTTNSTTTPSTPSQPMELITAGKIAEDIGYPMGRVQYVIRRKKYRPAAKAGRVNVFTNVDLSLIHAECNRMGKVRTRRTHP